MTQNDTPVPVHGDHEARQPPHQLHIPLRPGQDSVPAAPIDIHQAKVLPQWIDYNGHLNMAYYVLMFDNATDRFFDLIDLESVPKVYEGTQ